MDTKWRQSVLPLTTRSMRNSSSLECTTVGFRRPLTATDPWTMSLCPQSVKMPPQSPRFLSYGHTTTVVALPLQSQKMGRSFHIFDNKQAPSILHNMFFLLLSNYLLGSRIAIECRKQVNHSRNKRLGFIGPFITTLSIGPCAFTC